MSGRWGQVEHIDVDFGALSGYTSRVIDGGVAELTMPILVGDEVMWRLDSGRGEEGGVSVRWDLGEDD